MHSGRTRKLVGRMWACEMALEARDFRVGYASQVVVFDASLTLPAGKITAVIGPNGSGKSTLFKGIFGQARLFSGALVVDGAPVRSIDPRELVKLGVAYVPQLDNVFPSLTVQENLEIGRAGSKRVAAEVLALFPELHEKLGQSAARISGGQRSMLAIARALMSSPRALLLDEISAGLSPDIAQRVLGFLRDLANEGYAIGLVEQKARQALDVCDFGYLLRDGRVCFSGQRELWSSVSEEELSRLFLGGAIGLEEGYLVQGGQGSS